MSTRYACRVAAIALALALLPALAPGRPAHVAPDKHPHPQSPDLRYRGVTGFCDDPVLILEVAPLFTLANQDSTTGEGQVDAYACQSWPETGPEDVYELHITADCILDAWLDGGGPDHDLILLSACDSDSCLVQANTELSAVLGGSAGEPAVYYLVVDGYDGAAGDYTLNLEARHQGIAPEICEEGGPGEFLPSFSQLYESRTDALTSEGDLFAATNYVSIYDCSPITVRGGEAWYAISVSADSADVDYPRNLSLTLEAEPEVTTLDLVLWVFDGCGPEAQCLYFVDEANAGGTESLDLRNLPLEDQTLYLAVDSVQPATEFTGGFSLEILAVVPAEQRTLGGIKNLFR